MSIRALLLVVMVCGAALAQAQNSSAEVIRSAVRMARNGQYVQAETALKQLAEANPKEAEPQAALGELYYRFGYYDAAVPVLKRALELRPENRLLQCFQAVCLFKTHAPEQAVAAAKKLLSETPPPNDIDLTLTYAQYLYEKGDLDAALAQAQSATEFAAQHPIGYFWLARVLLAKGDVKQAESAAERSVALAPQLPFARNLLIRIYRTEGRTAEAEQQAEWLRSFEAQKASR